MTLDEFITQESSRWVRNAHVQEPDFNTLYVRWGYHRIGNDKGVAQCFDIANIEAKHPGKGAFKNLVKRIHKMLPPKIPIYVECVMTEHFVQGLLRMGFRRLDSELPSDFVLDRGDINQ